MKTKKEKTTFTPLNQNLLVRKLTKATAEENVGGVILPAGVNSEVVERVEIVAISPELYLHGDFKPTAQVGDVALIQRGLQGLPVQVAGVEHMMIGYTALVAIVR